jgi:hypothetical protein
LPAVSLTVAMEDQNALPRTTHHHRLGQEIQIETENQTERESETRSSQRGDPPRRVKPRMDHLNRRKWITSWPPPKEGD